MKTNVIYNDDCMNVLSMLPNDSVDCIVTDPPYEIEKRGGGITQGMLGTEQSRKGKLFDNCEISVSSYLPELYRVLKESGHCYIMCNNYNLFNFVNSVQESEFNFCKMLVWDKQNVIFNKYYMNGCEFIFMLYKGAAKPINNKGTSNLLRYKNVKMKDRNRENIHNSEKPVQLFQCLIENSTNVGDVVLDPFCGIGTLPIACMRANRKYIGIEIDESYYKIIQQRIKTEENSPRLFL